VNQKIYELGNMTLIPAKIVKKIMTRREERQQRIALSHQRKAEQRKKYEKEKMVTTVLIWLGLIILILMAFIIPNSSVDYYRAQNGLFLTSVLTIFASFAKYKIDDSFRHVLKKRNSSDTKLTVIEKANLLWMINFVLAIIGLLIVDLSFLNHGGLRIGAVITTAFVRIWMVLARHRK
jgi:hypothetical protein